MTKPVRMAEAASRVEVATTSRYKNTHFLMRPLVDCGIKGKVSEI